MKKASLFLSLFACCSLLISCSNDKERTVVKQPFEQKTYESIEDYHEEIGIRTVITKPGYKIDKDELHIRYAVDYRGDLVEKFKHTKKESYYTVTEVQGQNELGQWFDQSDAPVYRNDLDEIPKGENGYEYDVEIPLKEVPSEQGRETLLNGEHYVLMYLNEQKEVVNVLQVMDVGLNDNW